MEKKRRTPQEKKVFSYLKDTLGTGYAKNKRSGRRSVRKRKADVNRSYRRRIHQTLEVSNIEEGIDSEISSVKRKNWRKKRDPRALTHLDYVWSGSSRTKKSKRYKNSIARKLAVKHNVKMFGQHFIHKDD